MTPTTTMAPGVNVWATLSQPSWLSDLFPASGDELRSGVAARHDNGAGGEKASLEQIFLDIVGGERAMTPELSWLE